MKGICIIIDDTTWYCCYFDLRVSSLSDLHSETLKSMMCRDLALRERLPLQLHAVVMIFRLVPPWSRLATSVALSCSGLNCRYYELNLIQSLAV
jgi:hypothetical protein